MRRRLEGTGIELVGLSELPDPPPDVSETGKNERENARMKAEAYRTATGMTVLAADSGLYIEGIPDSEQPGEHTRRAQGERMSDEAMIRHYAGLAKSLGGRAVARYRNAFCIAFPDGRVAEAFDESVASERFYLVDTPHERRTEGYPLDSLSVDIKSGRYYFDMEQSRADSDLAQADGFRDFILRSIEVNT